MPVSFLSAAERARLNEFPVTISPEDLIIYFTLTNEDMSEIEQRRGASNRLGFALHICVLRYLGFFPDNFMTVSEEIIQYVAEQLDVSPNVLFDYAARERTGRSHMLETQHYLGFRRADDIDLESLEAWLLDRAMEHDRPVLLLQQLSEKLYAEKIVRLGITRLERLVAKARNQATLRTFELLKKVLSDADLVALDRLLDRDEELQQIPLVWLRHGATTNSPKAILDTLNKITFVRQWDVQDWDLQVMNPNRLRHLAQIARRSTGRSLRRSPSERRLPVLAAFLWQSYADLIDEAIDQYDRCLTETESRARRDLEKQRVQVSQAVNEKLRLFRQISGILLDPDVADEVVRPTVYHLVPQDVLQAAYEESQRLIRPPDDNHLDFVERRYSYLRQFAPVFLETLTFRSNRGDNSLLQAIRLLQDLNQNGLRIIPLDAPLTFIPRRWRPYVLPPGRSIDRHYYELCVLWELRNGLRSGDIWVEGSRRYANPDSYLIPPETWKVVRVEVCQMLQAPIDSTERLQERHNDLAGELVHFDRELPHSPDVRIENDKVVVTPLQADVTEGGQRLERALEVLLPRIELVDLLIEVDRWTNFTHHFQHMAKSEPRTEDLRAPLYAILIAQACNLGLTRMAELSGLSYNQLTWCMNWYVNTDALKAAATTLVNHQYHLPLSQYWGGGILSSSDGQRFPVSVQTRMAATLPRYFGYGRGLTFYTWTSDQFSQYGTKVIPATVRDATYVLDEILDNETELPIVEHTTDTAGYTDLAFGLFDLMGLRFAPRIRDLGDQRIFRPDRTIRYQHIDRLLKRTINWDLIAQHWDDLLRIAGSLKLGWVTASLLISKLQSPPRKSALTKALQEYGRLAKSIFLVRYLRSETYRREIGVQLNKGEALHALRRFLFFAHHGRIRHRQTEQHLHQANCLNLVTNAIITWNTVYMAAVLEHVMGDIRTIAPEDLKHLSPARFAHINPYGRYDFDLEKEFQRKGLRSLRLSGSS